MKVTQSFRAPERPRPPGVGSLICEYEYDGNHRRTVRRITNSADLDATYHDYYSGRSVVETRNGSDLVLKQNVWGVAYVDELIQISINDDPTEDDDTDTSYYLLHDALFNVKLMVNATGGTVERYEYSPYGEKTVYISPGSNDPDCYAPTHLPTRMTISSMSQPYAINDSGFRGKTHDDATGLIYNDHRYLSPRLGRFINRDMLHYPDGLNAYAAYFVMWGGLDPTGLIDVTNVFKEIGELLPYTPGVMESDIPFRDITKSCG